MGNFGTEVRAHRQKQSLTLSELAAKSGINLTYLSKIELGSMPPPSDQKVRSIAQTLQLDAEELVFSAHMDRLPGPIRKKIQDHLRKTNPKVVEKFSPHSPGQESNAKDKSEPAKIPVIQQALPGPQRSSFITRSARKTWLDWKGCHAIEVTSDHLAPIIYRGQKLIVSEETPAKDGEVSWITLHSGESMLKRIYRDSRNRWILLKSAHTHRWEPEIKLHPSQVLSSLKVVGIHV